MPLVASLKHFWWRECTKTNRKPVQLADKLLRDCSSYLFYFWNYLRRWHIMLDLLVWAWVCLCTCVCVHLSVCLFLCLSVNINLIPNLCSGCYNNLTGLNFLIKDNDQVFTMVLIASCLTVNRTKHSTHIILAWHPRSLFA